MRRNILLLSLLIITVTVCLGQTFGSEGTVWEHCIEEEWPDYYTTYKTRHIQTLVSDRTYNILEISRTSSVPIIVDTITLYEENNKLYLEDVDSTIILFDYDLNVGDTFGLVVPKVLNKTLFGYICDQNLVDIEPAYIEPARYVVTDVVNILIDGVLLKQWQMNIMSSPTPHFFPLSTFTERLGYQEFLFPLIAVSFLELNGEGEIASYKDDSIDYVNGSNNCTSLPTNDISISKLESISPNPTTGELTIELPDVLSGSLSVRDISGQIVLTQEIDYVDELSFDLYGYDAGMYVVEVISEDGKRYVERVVLY